MGHAVEFRIVQNLIQGLSDVGLVEWRTGRRREHPVWARPAVLQPRGAHLSAPEPKGGPKLRGQVHPPALMAFRGPQSATHQIALDLNDRSQLMLPHCKLTQRACPRAITRFLRDAGFGQTEFTSVFPLRSTAKTPGLYGALLAKVEGFRCR